MNLQTAADNLAARFVGVTATSGAETESIVVGPTADLQATIGVGPALIVFPPRGTLDVGQSALRGDTYLFPVLLLRDPANYPARTRWLYAWFNAMRDRVEMDTDLGLPTYVQQAQPVAVRIEIDGEQYAGKTYDVVELTVAVRVEEPVTTVGP